MISRSRRLIPSPVDCLLGSLAASLVALCLAPVLAQARVRADFNGDGYDDLALGNEGENVDGAFDAGAVHVLYGAPGGLSLDGNQFLTAATPGIQGDGPKTFDFFGDDVAAADFDSDGYDDLAIGVPNQGVASENSDDGAVDVLYGSPAGLSLEGNQYLTQDTPGILGDGAQDGDGFGGALAAGDFDGDGRDDLAIASPGERPNDDPYADTDGAVNILFGGNRHLRPHGGQYLTEDMAGMAGKDESGNNFGAALAAADFDGDRRADLAIGAPYEGDFAGAAHVLFAGRHGLSLRGDQYLTQDTPGIAGNGAQAVDLFGGALVAGRLDGDRRADLAIGV